MTTLDNDPTTAEAGRFCPECGQTAGDSNFCSRCGHNMGFAAARTPVETAAQPSSAGVKPRRRVGFIIAGGVVAVAAVAVAAIVLLNSPSNSKASPTAPPGPSASTVYHQQLTKVLTPVISANQAVSNSLIAMSGSKHATKTAKTRASEALSALSEARGGLKVLSAPSADVTLSDQVQQALTTDNGYLEAVSATLAAPVGSGAGQLQSLATGAQSALVNLDPVVSGASSSISGTDTLTSWAQGATRAAHRAAANKAKAAASTATTPAPAPATPAPAVPVSPSPGLTACDQNISVDSATTTCQFADSVFGGYATIVQAEGPVSADVTATSSTTGSTYTDTCDYDGSTGMVVCSHGTDVIQFPEEAAAVY